MDDTPVASATTRHTRRQQRWCCVPTDLIDLPYRRMDDHSCQVGVHFFSCSFHWDWDTAFSRENVYENGLVFMFNGFGNVRYILKTTLKAKVKMSDYSHACHRQQQQYFIQTPYAPVHQLCVAVCPICVPMSLAFRVCVVQYVMRCVRAQQVVVVSC